MTAKATTTYPNWMLAGIAFFAVAQVGFGLRYYLDGDVGLALGSLVMIALLGYVLVSAYSERVEEA